MEEIKISDSEFIKGKHIYSAQEKLEWFDNGEWVNELDEIIFTYKGYTCEVKRICMREPSVIDLPMFGGYLCGYVHILKEDIAYEMDYNDLSIDCHCGLTFSDKNPEINTWMIGFDCAHSRDLVPSLEKILKCIINRKELNRSLEEKYPFLKKTYKNLSFVIEECKSIVDQLIEMN